jgi:hypothetical protein
VQPFGFLIVDYAVRLQRRCAIIKLHITEGGNTLIAVIVIDLLRAHEHLILAAGGYGSRRWFLASGKCEQLCRGRGDLRGKKAAQQGQNDGRTAADATPRKAAAENAVAPHHPSS